MRAYQIQIKQHGEWRSCSVGLTTTKTGKQVVKLWTTDFEHFLKTVKLYLSDRGPSKDEFRLRYKTQIAEREPK